jgi:hypothetical protein
MILDKKSHGIRRCGMVGVSALAVVLVAAVADLDPNWVRIRAMPPEQRSKLLQVLRKFDLELPPEKQAAIRELDRRIAQLDPQQRARYYWVLHRYHDWLNRLPENRQDEVLAQPPDDRLALIRKLIVQHAVPTSETPEFLRIAEVGELSPFELASAFRIWQASSQSQHEIVERRPQEKGRREGLFQLGSRLDPPVPRETKPADFDEERWIGLVEEYWRKTRPVMLLDEAARKKMDEAAKKKYDAIRRETHRRQAVNLYTTKTKKRAVDPERLTKFVTALPSWLQNGVDPYPPDEARRRLTWAYRLVFPYPDEIGALRAPSASSAKGAPRSSQKKTGPTPAKSKPASTSLSDAPY